MALPKTNLPNGTKRSDSPEVVLATIRERWNHIPIYDDRVPRYLTWDVSWLLAYVEELRRG